MTSGKVLVVLPTLGDRLDTLAETLRSVDVQRSDVDLTLALVVPASSTAAIDLGRAHGALIVDDPRKGISPAINAGIAAATDEEFYAWMGDDDLFRPGGLRTLRDLLDAAPEAVLAYGGCDYIDPQGRTIGTSRAGRLAQWLLAWGPDLIPHPGTMIRLDALRAIGCFDADLRYAMDLDAFLSLRSHGRFVCTTSSVSAFRWHPDSLTVANRAASSAESEAVKSRHLPTYLRPVEPLWRAPVRWASAWAARGVSRRAIRIARTEGARAL
ncbi:MAG TPA: glycosyltransferase [Candidatus Angelobacter sp.]|nr:glycosyltransferase [Candidatus Angelobacter sp.]